ncbi:hypothetical protein [Kocuria turfanensis]|uniref:Uncharacterized protein n=1 Tax=Kocuria turfanensis TaxID=388357 RepID=A0A512I868_9MICC|nr:hypothetical protein [Kocuria turfanensis]GEO93892.1 hypothetical protein KTU01_00150 [Kocuria turfanensis]
MIWVSSSAVLAVVCALCLVWVVPRLQRRRGVPAAAQAQDTGPDVAGAAPAAGELPPQAAVPFPESRRRRITMATTDTVSPSSGAARRPGALRVRRGRAGIFLAGCTALLAALVTALVAPFSAAVSWPWPVFLLLLGVGSVLALRYLAVQDRSARRRSRPVPAATVDPHAPRGDVALFDNEDGAVEQSPAELPPAAQDEPAEDLDLPAEHEQPRVPPAFTVEELRAEALRVARESADPGRTWEPVPVPRPTYAEAPVVERPAPEPLPVPEQPTSRSSSLKDAVRTGEERGRAALDLDDVLKRRRA